MPGAHDADMLPAMRASATLRRGFEGIPTIGEVAMRIWSNLVAPILVFLLACGLVLSGTFFRTNLAPAELLWRDWAVVVCATIVPALGLLVWLRAGAGASPGTKLALVVAAIVGAASSLVLSFLLWGDWLW
jgi:hypothetical protein